ncbi:UNVERIFIED_CONTAM: putative lysine-specific demethylase ELF6 [Sesamum latifolium]|uniref:Lysine-specific demethylase ELF6 n=1 Tax=Sesamum latifolium TaxID=2727402 RepID=A0AAW2XEK2_9LAMI
MLKEVNPLVIEAMFWKAASEKPIYVEYANDVPGSAFGEPEGSLRYFDRRRRRRRKRHSFDRNNLGNSDSKNDQVDTGNSISGNNDSGSQNNHNICTETASNCLLSNQSHHGASFSGRKDFEGGDEMEGTAGWKLSNCPWNLQVIARFAWHVEDHELHSLNFLHMGSAKTWYAVPGDYAFNFEETIRLHGYGGNADRLVALSVLGEKTTILSPEIIVAAGIPHVAGFNCGEAANFGTPKWLTIAKEAAVRRAAMNYLPMLSHQQLLYLLTMSFISSVLSRIIMDDILPWFDAPLDLGNRPIVCIDTLGSALLGSKLYNSVYFCINYRDSTFGFDLNDDDLAYDFQIESGTLPCVACGILGFPFMAVVQPSEVASTNLLLTDPLIVSAESGQPSELNPVKEGAAKDFTDETKLNKKDLHHVNEASSVAETSQSTHQAMEQASVPSPSSLEHEAFSSQVKIAKGWNISNVSLKPRIFCLEHAIEIEGLLSSKGGANVLVICHSDFQKIKTHAAVIAEEIGVPFCYTDVELSNASPEDLNLIDIAIDREEQVDCAEDWTSKLNINLQHCVKVKKNSPSKNVQHLLSLGGLFCDAIPISNASGVKWLSRKLRSKRHMKRLLQSKRSDSKEDMNTNKEHQMAKKDVKIIQYSRKRYKSRTSAGIQVPIESNNLVVRDTLDIDAEDLDKDDKNMSRSILTRVETNGKSFSGPSALPYDSVSESPRDHHGLLSSRGSLENSFPSHHANSVIVSTPIIENVEAQTSISPPNELAVSENVGSTSDENGIGNAADVTLREEETMDESIAGTKACDLVADTDSEMLHNVQSDGDDLTKEASEHGGSSNCSDDEPPTERDEQMEAISDQLVTDSEVSKSSSPERQQHIERDGDNEGDADSGYTAGIHESTSASTEERLPGDRLVDVAS